MPDANAIKAYSYLESIFQFTYIMSLKGWFFQSPHIFLPVIGRGRRDAKDVRITSPICFIHGNMIEDTELKSFDK